MGILSNPETRSQIASYISKYGNIASVGCFVGGLIWFLALSHPAYNGGVYFSENALLPGLVNTGFQGVGLRTIIEEYQAELKKSNKSEGQVPIDWLKKKLVSIGLEVHEQLYQFTYPLNLMNNQTVEGNNIYGILRAPRSASTECMVMSVPLRPLSSGLAATDGSVAIMLALASHMIKHTYWSKDIIFLFTQHEFVGVQAWLDGYFEVQTSSYVKAERLPARAGLIQAAINLELSGMSFGGIDVLIEGINGLLPNLDLVNLVHKLARENGIRSTIHHRPDLFSKDLDKLVPHNILTTFTMMANLATGMPSGNHGLFLRFRVDSLTIKSVPGGSSGLNSVGQLVEGVFRSINNLLEKFHQSFFFYLMPCTYRYISIGLYIPPFALMVAASLIQAIMLWSRFTFEVDTKKSKLIANQDQAFTSDGKFTDDTIHTLRLPDNVVQGVYSLIPLIVGCHLSGLMLLKAPSLFGGGEVKQMPAADTVILGGLAGIVSSMMLIRTVLRKEEFDGINWYLFKTISLIYHGLTLFLLSLLNISLAAIVAAFTVPVYTVIRPTSYKLLTGLQMLLLLLISPVSIILICQTLYNVVTGNAQIHSLEFFSLLTDLQHSVLYAIIDHLVYKNYLLNIVCLVLYPTWLMFWSLLFMNV